MERRMEVCAAHFLFLRAVREKIVSQKGQTPPDFVEVPSPLGP